MKRREKHLDVLYERRDADWRLLLLAAAGVGLLLLALLAVLWWIYGARLQPSGPPSVDQAEYRFTHGPEWKSRVVEARENLWTLEKERMTTYKWRDREERILQIPVNEALQYMVHHGVPVWEPVETPPESPYNLSRSND